jgi:hypothetical protein
LPRSSKKPQQLPFLGRLEELVENLHELFVLGVNFLDAGVAAKKS